MDTLFTEVEILTDEELKELTKDYDFSQKITDGAGGEDE